MIRNRCDALQPDIGTCDRHAPDADLASLQRCLTLPPLRKALPSAPLTARTGTSVAPSWAPLVADSLGTLGAWGASTKSPDRFAVRKTTARHLGACGVEPHAVLPKTLFVWPQGTAVLQGHTFGEAVVDNAGTCVPAFSRPQRSLPEQNKSE
jgi:hypothetical protein